MADVILRRVKVSLPAVCARVSPLLSTRLHAWWRMLLGLLCKDTLTQLSGHLRIHSSLSGPALLASALACYRSTSVSVMAASVCEWMVEGPDWLVLCLKLPSSRPTHPHHQSCCCCLFFKLKLISSHSLRQGCLISDLIKGHSIYIFISYVSCSLIFKLGN